MNYQFEYLPVTHAECPVSKIFTVGESVYTYEFKHNARHDFYTLTIKDADDVTLYTTKIVYGCPIVHAIVDGLEIDFDIVALNLDDIFTPYRIADTTVNKTNLDTTVRLYIDNVTTL